MQVKMSLRKVCYNPICYSLFISLALLSSCTKRSINTTAEDLTMAKKVLVEWNQRVIDIMRLDGINPVLATRMFSYPNIAAYESLAALHPGELSSFGGKLHGWSGAKKIEIAPGLSAEVAVLSAYYFTAKAMVYREDMLDSAYQNHLQRLKLEEKMVKRSAQVGKEVASKIIAWSKTDGYKETKGMPYYIISNTPGAWVPTPPEYRSALEPNWDKLRTFVIDSLESVSVPFEIEFDTTQESAFYELANEVYLASKERAYEDSLLAIYWDDNPDLNTFKGHVPTPRRHINPASHWISMINQVVSQDSSINVFDAATIYATASIAFFDANLCSWHDKYKYNLIRPVTYIRKYIDPDWMPIIITPPFPEYTSAHASCSFAVATVLNRLVGENYSFVDSTHLEMGWGVRNLSGFNEAASQVAMSRFYGGIHYMTACKAGQKQGDMVGQEIIEKVVE